MSRTIYELLHGDGVTDERTYTHTRYRRNYDIAQLRYYYNFNQDQVYQSDPDLRADIMQELHSVHYNVHALMLSFSA
jgi:hypothetical protein